MVNISLPDDVAQALTELAQTQQRPIGDVVAEMLNLYKGEDSQQVVSDSAFESVIGVFDDDITDLSTTTRETLQQIIRDKYGRSD